SLTVQLMISDRETARGAAQTEACPLPKARRLRRRGRCLLECRAQVVPEVVDVFAADAEAQEPGGDVALSGELAAPLDGALDAAQAGGVDDDAQVIAEPVGGGSVGDLEGQHGAEAGHLRGGGAVSGVAGKARVAHA